MHLAKFTFWCCLYWWLLLANSVAQSTVAYHSGYANPTTEQWQQVQTWASHTSGITNDDGRNSWAIIVNNSQTSYYTSLSTNLLSSDWMLSISIRVLTPCSGIFHTFMNSGGSLYYLSFGADAGGRQTISIHNSTYMLSDNSAYADYRLSYNQQSKTASLWGNNSLLASGLSGDNLNGNVLEWEGGFQGSGLYQANWNLVALQIIPEPSTFAIIVIGSSLLIGQRRSRINACAY